MADFIEEYFTKTAKRFERFLARKWRKPIGLASILAIVTFCFYFETEKLIPSFEANKNVWLLVALLLDTTAVWAYYKYRNKLIVNKPKFGILIHADNNNREEVDRILLPLLDELKEEIGEFKFIGISSSVLAI